MAANTAAWSLVGGCTEKPLSLKLTTPTRTVGG